MKWALGRAAMVVVGEGDEDLRPRGGVISSIKRRKSVLCRTGLPADYASSLTHAHGRSSFFLSREWSAGDLASTSYRRLSALPMAAAQCRRALRAAPQCAKAVSGSSAGAATDAGVPVHALY